MNCGPTSADKVSASLPIASSPGTDRVPLEAAHGRHLEVQPLAALVRHARLGETDLHDAGRVKENLGDGRRPARADLAQDALGKVEEAGPDDAG